MASKKKAVEAKAPESKQEEAKPAHPIVSLHYHGDNHHALDHVHVLKKGKQHVSKHLWDSVKAAPAVQKLIADGHLVVEGGEEEAAAEAPSMSEAQALAEGEADAAAE